MKIPFDIKYRPQIESGEYKVVTRDDRPARIICCDRFATESYDNIIALVSKTKFETAYYYYQDGHLWNKANGEGDSQLDLFIITPELELSEDERIRNEILIYIGARQDIDLETHNRWCAYLEKQKGKMTAEEYEKSELFQLKLKTKYANGYQDGQAQKEQKPADYPYLPGWRKNRDENKPELKRSVLMLTTHGVAEGEWLGEKWCQYRWSCELKDDEVLYWMHLSDLERLEKEDEEKQKEQKPWKVGANAYFTPEQKPAEKHDLVAQLKEHLANATKEQLEAEWKELEKWNDVGPTVEEYLGGIKPAEYIKRNSKEWYSLLAEQYDKGFWKGKAEQKPAEWSKGDEEMLQSIIKDFRAGKVSTIGQEQWLKSLPERFNLQPKQEWSEEDIKKIRSEEYTKGFNDAAFGGKLKEWSEEDEKYLNRVINLWVNDFGEDSDTVKWLKSLRPSWKPSEEQMHGLAHAINLDVYDAKRYRLDSLYSDLKKLM